MDFRVFLHLWYFWRVWNILTRFERIFWKRLRRQYILTHPFKFSIKMFTRILITMNFVNVPYRLSYQSMWVKIKVLILTKNMTFSNVKCWRRGHELSPKRVRAEREKGREIFCCISEANCFRNLVIMVVWEELN